MKYCIRKPNFKNSIKARTTGKIKRHLKSSTDPLYGNKGMGILKNPKKAIYNKIYRKTSVGIKSAARSMSASVSTDSKDRHSQKMALSNEPQEYAFELASGITTFIFATIFLAVFIFLSVLLPFLAFLLVVPIVMYVISVKHFIRADGLKKEQ